MMYSNVIAGRITISRSSFVFSQACVEVSASLANVEAWQSEHLIL